MGKVVRFFLYLAVFLAAAGIAAVAVNRWAIRGADTVVVPDLAGKDLVYSLETLTGLGLNLKLKGFDYSEAVARNRVLSQDPEPGREIKKDRDVRVLLSAGPRFVVAADLVGLSEREAAIALARDGLNTGWVSRCPIPALPAGAVAAQFPPAGERMVRNAPVMLLVSQGSPKAWFAMPDLSGLAPEDAVLLCERLSLTVAAIAEAADPNAPDGVVIDQKPGFGYRVASGDRVDLTVNRLSPPGETDRREPGMRVLRVRPRLGLLKRRVRLRSGGPGDLADRFVAPGRPVWLLIPRGAENTAIVFLDQNTVKPGETPYSLFSWEDFPGLAPDEEHPPSAGF